MESPVRFNVSKLHPPCWEGGEFTLAQKAVHQVRRSDILAHSPVSVYPRASGRGSRARCATSWRCRLRRRRRRLRRRRPRHRRSPFRGSQSWADKTWARTWRRRRPKERERERESVRQPQVAGLRVRKPAPGCHSMKTVSRASLHPQKSVPHHLCRSRLRKTVSTVVDSSSHCLNLKVLCQVTHVLEASFN